MRLTLLAPLVIVSVLSVSNAFAAGPTPGRGPWIACPNNSVVCEAQLGPDLDGTNEVFDCQTRNGRLGAALQNSHSGNVKCWAS